MNQIVENGTDFETVTAEEMMRREGFAFLFVYNSRTEYAPVGPKSMAMKAVSSVGLQPRNLRGMAFSNVYITEDARANLGEVKYEDVLLNLRPTLYTASGSFHIVNSTTKRELT